MNRQQLIGNLAADAQYRETQKGNVTTFRVITNEQVGERSFSTGHNVVLFGNRGPALVANGMLRKGQEVYVEGRTEHRSYEAQDGTTKWRCEVIVRNPSQDLVLLRTPKTREEEPPPPEDDDYSDLFLPSN